MAIVTPSNLALAEDSQPPRLFVSKPNTVLKINCGCGERFTSIIDAERHSSTTGHTLHILGTIRSR